MTEQGGVSLNLFSGVDFKKELGFEYFEADDIREVNEGYKAMGIEVVPIKPGEGGQRRGVYHYNVINKETGEVINKDMLSPRSLQAWLSNRNNFTEEQKIAFQDSVDSTYKKEKDLKENIRKNPAVQADRGQSDIDFKLSKKRFEYSDIVFNGISEEGRKTVNSYLNRPIVSDDGEYEPEDNWQATRFDNLLSDEVYNSLSDEDKQVFEQAKIRSQEKDDNGKTLLDRYLDKQHLAANEKVWNAEYAEVKTRVL